MAQMAKSVQLGKSLSFILFEKRAKFNFFSYYQRCLKKGDGQFFKRMSVRAALDHLSEAKLLFQAWQETGYKGSYESYLVDNFCFYSAYKPPVGLVSINYFGMENYQKLKERGKRILLLQWHHGHCGFAQGILNKIIPDIVLYGTQPGGGRAGKFTEGTEVLFLNPTQMALSLYRDLLEMKTVSIYFDGILGGRPLQSNFFGETIYLPTSAAALFKMLDNIVVLPVTGYFNSPDEFNFFIGDNIFFEEKYFRGLSEHKLTEVILDGFKSNLKANAPASISAGYFQRLRNKQRNYSFFEAGAEREKYL